MEPKKQIKSDEIRCFNIITNKKDRRYGLQCNRLLLKKNSKGKVSGEIKCSQCGAKYEIIDGKIILIDRGDKK